MISISLDALAMGMVIVLGVILILLLTQFILWTIGDLKNEKNSKEEK
jgi:hypothetical protein